MAQSVWAPPPRTSPPPPPPVTVAPPPPVTIRPTVIPYYDPGRIFRDIKVVQDLRQSGTERGETQSGDGELLGPSEIAPPRTTNGKVARPQNALVPIALAIAAFLIFGG